MAALLSAAWLGSARANPGDLDPTFGTGGIVTTPIGPGTDVAYALVKQADGKLVAAGPSWNGTDYDVALVRYNADGSLDGTFGSGGTVTTSIGAGDEEVDALVQQTDGKLVAAGRSHNGTDFDFALVRYNPDGSLDGSFGSGGKVTTAIGPTHDLPYALVQQMDGKLVAAGSSWNGTTSYHVALVRYNADGSLDGTFGTGGKVTTPIGPSYDLAYALVQQADGKLVAAGHYSPTNGTNVGVALVRYNADGSLDGTFGSGGKVTTSIAGTDDVAKTLVQQADGKLVAAGYSYNGTNYDVALVRYNADGSLDGSFGSGGKVTTAIGPENDMAHALVQQVDGKLVAAGQSHNGSDYDIALVRYDVDGSLDGSFGSGGKVTTAIGTSVDVADALVQQADGKLVAAGYSLDGTNYDFALVRYVATGSSPTSSTSSTTSSTTTTSSTSTTTTHPPMCGDGFVEGTEQCDDGAGNGTAGSCCTATCAPRPAGTDCEDDGDLCTNDRCNGAGVCTHPVGPAPTCLEPTVAGGGVLTIASNLAPALDQVIFKWSKGPIVPKADFGAPASATAYRMCVYQGDGTLVYRGQPPRGACGLACWKDLPRGWKFTSQTGAPDGITGIRLKEGLVPLKARLQVKARGNLLLATLPLQPSVVAQLRTSDGRCWGATFPSPRANTATRFSGKSVP